MYLYVDCTPVYVYTSATCATGAAKWCRKREGIYTRRGVTSRVTCEYIVDHQLPRTDYELIVSDGQEEYEEKKEDE